MQEAKEKAQLTDKGDTFAMGMLIWEMVHATFAPGVLRALKAQCAPAPLAGSCPAGSAILLICIRHCCTWWVTPHKLHLVDHADASWHLRMRVLVAHPPQPCLTAARAAAGASRSGWTAAGRAPRGSRSSSAAASRSPPTRGPPPRRSSTSSTFASPRCARQRSSLPRLRHQRRSPAGRRQCRRRSTCPRRRRQRSHLRHR